MLLTFYRIYAFLPAIALKSCLAKEPVNTASGLMTNGEYVFSGGKRMPTMWKSLIIIDHYS